MLFGHSEQQYSIMLRGSFAARGSGALNKVNGIMKRGEYLHILHKNLKSSAEDWVLGTVGDPTGK